MDISVSHGLDGRSDNKYVKLCSIRSKRSDASRTGQADIILANSEFTARVTMAHFSSLTTTPKAVCPGINIEAYQLLSEPMDPEIVQVCS